MNKQILAVQLPAPCPLHCAFCRTPEHNIGNHEDVFQKVFEMINKKKYDELYLTSNGETGLSKAFPRLIALAKERNIPVSVLCATKYSVVPGLARVEVSYNDFTMPMAVEAIHKAQSLEIPIILSVVDDGSSKKMDFRQLQSNFSSFDKIWIDGILVRALQKEGLSQKTAGESQVLRFGEKDLGAFPAIAYRELENFGDRADCINHFGKSVRFLGAA